jgi:hypothetical protein
MIEKSDRKERERRLEQARRAVALLNDPVTRAPPEAGQRFGRAAPGGLLSEPRESVA